MEVIGLDPSLSCTGLAITGPTGATHVQRFPTVAADSLSAVDTRIRYIVGSVLRWAPKQCLTVIERPYVPQGQGAAGQLVERCWLFGMLVDQLLLRGPVVDVRPSLRAKYAAGTGNAKKPAVLAAVREAFPMVPLRDDNEADALALAAMGARYLGFPIDGEPSKAQTQAMSAVRWPTPMKEQ